MPVSALHSRGDDESSEIVASRVGCARQRQLARQGSANATLANREIHEHCRMAPAARKTLERATASLGLSARAHHRILKVARTIADLASEDEIGTVQISEAIALRKLDRSRINGGGIAPPPESGVT